MIVIECEQGSPEWHKARAGVITASNFKLATQRLKTGPDKGGFTAKAKEHAFGLAIERISQEPLDGGYQTWQMKRGHELEPEARLRHQEEIGVNIQRAGVVLTEDRVFGGSADGLIGGDGGSEYKCLIGTESMYEVVISGDISEYKPQFQGCLWLTGRRWWDFCVYLPMLASVGRDLMRWRIERDDSYIDGELVPALLEYKELVDSYERRLRGI